MQQSGGENIQSAADFTNLSKWMGVFQLNKYPQQNELNSDSLNNAARGTKLLFLDIFRDRVLFFICHLKTVKMKSVSSWG